MLTLCRIDKLPRNFDEYVEEVGIGVEALYGRTASVAYRASARKEAAAALAHPLVDALAMCHGDTAAGMLFGLVRETVGEIFFVHVLGRYAHQGIEQRLVRESVRTFRAAGVDGILSEQMPVCVLELENTYADLGFTKVERLLMTASLDTPNLRQTGEETTVPCQETDWAEVAEIMVEAYQDHPGRNLHAEVRSAGDAGSFLARVISHGYGPTRAAYNRVVRVGKRCAGAVIGCEVAPDVGFVLYAVVRPSHQNQGLGGRLLREEAAAFREAGLHRMALGVTAANPARRLYERLGFTALRRVEAYTWWRPGS